MQQVSDHLALCIGSNLPKSNYVARAFKTTCSFFKCTRNTLTDFKSPKESQLTSENQLFEYINYCTEINVNLLLNSCNFHRKFRFTFSLILSENASNVHFREAKFQNVPPSALVLSTHDPIYAGPTLNCFRRACLTCMKSYLIEQTRLDLTSTEKWVVLMHNIAFNQHCIFWYFLLTSGFIQSSNVFSLPGPIIKLNSSKVWFTKR